MVGRCIEMWMAKEGGCSLVRSEKPTMEPSQAYHGRWFQSVSHLYRYSEDFQFRVMPGEAAKTCMVSIFHHSAQDSKF